MAPTSIEPPPVFGGSEHLFPTSGDALEIACGRGRAAVWLAARGMDVWGVDVSPVAIEFAAELADACGLSERCRFTVHDLDHGLPDGPAVDLVLCHLFWDPGLVEPMIDRVSPDGLLAVATLSEAGVGPGAFRVQEGELERRFAGTEILQAGEGDGVAWLIARP